MVIVHLGIVSLQVERSRSRQAFVERFIAQVEEKVPHVVERCIEWALEAEVSHVTTSLGTCTLKAQPNSLRERYTTEYASQQPHKPQFKSTECYLTEGHCL